MYFFITLQNYENAELDKAEMLMSYKKKKKKKEKRTLSTEKEYYQEIWNIKKKTKAFQNIVTIFKINSINFSFFLFLYIR